MTRKKLTWSVFLFWVAVFGISDPLFAQGEADVYRQLPWRELGPAAFGGRISDVEAVPSDPKTVFVAAASGGIFRTQNNGVTWTPVFDEEGILLSVGDIAIVPSDPQVVWAGTGEPNNRQSSSWGHGVYRSLDGGSTWEHMGLEQTHHVGRVVIDPGDPQTVFVAALGHLWGPNPERGLYRTRDAGKTWQKVLEIDADTGVVDVAMEANGRVLYAAAYQRRRRAFGFVGGGDGSGIYRSLDGGDSWVRLSEGLPKGPTGRIGLSIAASAPKTVYAIVENKEGGVFRSDDRGETWSKVNSLNPRPMYYSQIRVDPNNPDKVWVLGSPLFVSIDGGKTFSQEETGRKIHVDHHALWIDPSDSDHLMLGNDGGLYFSYDGSKNWDFIDNLPIAQFYAIAYDGADPYRIFGGTQDNGTWGLPVRTYSLLGITNLDVLNVAYGDGFYVQIDDRQSRTIFAESQNGRLYRVDMETKEEKGIAPIPMDPKEEFRFNWSSPILISPHNPEVIYYGGNKLFRSEDSGHSWQEISPDLTLNQEWKKLPVMGVERSEETLSRDDGIAGYGTITSIAESPLTAGLLYVGTDDGMVQVSTDGGKNWSEVGGGLGLSERHWVTRVLASQHQPNRVFLSLSGHQDDDFEPYIFRSDDAGRTWTRLSSGLDQGDVVNALAEHPRQPDLLFAGTERGLFISGDGGQNWSLASGKLPRVPVDDILIHPKENDLILGTHGRGFWVLDDLAALEGLSTGVPQQALTLFDPRPAVQFYKARELPVPGASEFSAPNPPDGALITYFVGPLAEGQSAEEVTVRVEDSEGDLVREMKGPGDPGLHRVAWDLRFPVGLEEGSDEEGWFGPVMGPFVLPGAYSVKVSGYGAEQTRTVEVVVDPKAQTDPEALRERFELTRQVNHLLGVFSKTEKALKDLQKDISRIEEHLTPQDEELKKQLEQLKTQVEEVGAFFKPGWESRKFRFTDLLGQLQASTSRPTEAQQRRARFLEEELRDRVTKLNEIGEGPLKGLLEGIGSRLIESAFRPVSLP